MYILWILFFNKESLCRFLNIWIFCNREQIEFNKPNYKIMMRKYRRNIVIIPIKDDSFLNIGTCGKVRFLRKIFFRKKYFTKIFKFQFLTTFSIFHPHFDFWPRFLIFDQNFDFWRKIKNKLSISSGTNSVGRNSDH